MFDDINFKDFDEEDDELAEYCHQNYLKNKLLKQENEQKSKLLLDKYLDNEKRDKSEEKPVKVNFKKFTSKGISISKAIYGKQRLDSTKQIEELIKKQKTPNLTRIANSLNLNLQDLNFINKQVIDTEKLRQLITGTRSNWIETAKLYGTKYSAIQLFKHYKTAINPNLKKTEFTQEEERLLKRGIELYKNNSAAITTLLPGRDLSQIHAKRKYFMKKVGKWDEDEDEKLLRAVELHTSSLGSSRDTATDSAKTILNINWLLVSEAMQTRNAEQCRNRYINKLNPNLDHSKLTSDEKKKVLDLAADLGVGRLKEVASHFPCRSPQMITNCYKVHSRKKVKTSRKRKKPD